MEMCPTEYSLWHIFSSMNVSVCEQSHNEIYVDNLKIIRCCARVWKSNAFNIALTIELMIDRGRVGVMHNICKNTIQFG